ncbi:MAG: LytR C-terminal domain-containing protein [Gemmatimonadota bacterium]
MLRLVGLFATFAAVFVLLGSLVAGLGDRASPQDYRVPVTTAVPPAADPIRVEVLNGTRVSGLARRVTERLRDQGFDVVFYGNAGSLARDSTTILDRAGNPAAAEALGQALGVDRIVSAIDTTLYLEATLILGPDWEEQQGIGNRE